MTNVIYCSPRRGPDSQLELVYQRLVIYDTLWGNCIMTDQ
jgi:hypothetical protein